VAVLPPGFDPDQAIRRQPESWPAVLAGAQPLLDYKFQTVAVSLEGARPWERSRAVDELLPLLGLIGDRIVQAHYLQRLARLAQVREAELQQMLLRQSTKRRSVAAVAELPTAVATATGDRPEEHCLVLLLRYPELRNEGLAVPVELFWATENREILRAWQQAVDMEEVAQMVPPELEAHLRRLSEASLPPFPPEVALERLRGAIGSLKKREMLHETELRGAAVVDREEERRLTEDELAVAVEASRTGVIPVEAGVDPSRVSAILDDMEIGLRLHQDSKMERDEEDQRYMGAEKVENG
jgi:DNA primase